MATLSVITNSFIISQLPKVSFYQYEVSFSPDIPVASKREAAINKLQTLNPAVFYPRGVYNGKEHLYLSKQLPGAGTFNVYMGEASPPPPTGSPGYYRVTISRTAAQAITPSEIPQLLVSGSSFVREKLSTATTVLQLLIRQSINENNPTHTRRAFFGPAGKKILPNDGIELWRGFFHSVRAVLIGTGNQKIGQMVVTINTTMTAMLHPGRGSLVDLAMTIYSARNVRDLNGDDYLRKLQSHLKRRRITIKGVGRDQQTKVAYELVRGPVGSIRFKKDGRDIELFDYYKRTYNITLQYPTSFGVQTSGEKAPFRVIIPAELCYLKPGQLYRRRLPTSASADAVRFATQSSADRLRAIVGKAESGTESPILSYQQSQYIIESGMRIEMKPMDVAAKTLPHPKMLFGENGFLYPKDGAWNILGKKFQLPVKLEHWAVVNLIRLDVEKIVRALIQACQETGMQIFPQPQLINGNPQNVEAALETARLQGNVQMIVVILPASAEAVKHHVKFWGNVKHGIPTQCLREGKVKADSQYLNNVAIKLNARLGGRYALPDGGALSDLQQDKDIGPMMVIGADVSHPAPGVLQPSFTGLVYSTDRQATQYVALSSVQEPRLEEIKDLKKMVKYAILDFGARNPIPKSILFLRDGVSEGEMEHVQRTEIEAIKEACREIWQEKQVPGPRPKITFIVVVKRHHQRFFPKHSSDGDKKGNTKAGLCVEQFRSPLALDFYLQSHAAIQGTPRPAHYSVLQDEIFGANVSKIQRACFELCHVYAKATRSVSIPAPVYYADLLCSHAKYRFNPEFDFDAGSTTSGEDMFDLGLWKSHFMDISRSEITTEMRTGTVVTKFHRSMWFL
ncbi:argonaute-like protein [Mycena amicta]|nr:argonaute-like protein [Mycena amicta]